jgi:hypothetical protein
VKINFAEELVAEWWRYHYKAVVETNVSLEGGHEIDVLGVVPSSFFGRFILDTANPSADSADGSDNSTPNGFGSPQLVVHIECGFGAEGRDYLRKKIDWICSLSMEDYCTRLGYLPTPEQVHVIFILDKKEMVGDEHQRQPIPCLITDYYNRCSSPRIPRDHIHYVSLKQLFAAIRDEIETLPDPSVRAIPETYMLLRAFQFWHRRASRELGSFNNGGERGGHNRRKGPPGAG